MNTLNAHNLTIANLACREVSRFTLNGIHITPTHTEVTDGHLAMRVSLPDIDAASFPLDPADNLTPCEGNATLATEHAIALAKALPRKTNLPVLQTVALVQNGAIGEDGRPKRYVVSNDLETVTKKPVMVTGSFPDLSRVMPASLGSDTLAVVTLDARLLGAICSQVAKMAGKGAAPLTIQVYSDQLRPVRIDATTEAGQTVEAALMPMRNDREDIKAWRANAAKSAAVKEVAQ